MPHPLHDELLAFVRKAATLGPHAAGQYRLSRLVTGPWSSWESKNLTLIFGSGYFDTTKVQVWLDGSLLGLAEIEEAVSAYLDGLTPKTESN